MKTILLALFALTFGLVACQQTAPKPEGGTDSSSVQKDSTAATAAPAEETQLKPSGSIYRGDGLRPGLTSEWIQVRFSESQNKVEGMWYWNTSDEKPMALTVEKQEFTDGEISGFTGTLLMPDKSKASFGIVENIVTLTPEGEKMLEFEYEESK